MTLKVMRARKARKPQIAGDMKSTAQKKLLSVGWMKRCSCAQEIHRHAAWRRSLGLGLRGRGGRVPRSSRISSCSVQPRPRHSTTSDRRAAALRRS